jgi:hypothetical protein
VTPLDPTIDVDAVMGGFTLILASGFIAAWAGLGVALVRRLLSA